ncbi:MAG: Membrane protein insertase YidC [Chlamydiia bacterium]|nr:Membrane protein insertase YidC [Chlamydiia bacterium]
MDKRGFLLIFVFTIFMFFVHHFFMGDKSKTSKPDQVIETVVPQLSSQEVSSKTANLSSLPIVEFFSDMQGSTSEGLGLGFGDSYLIYPRSKNNELPKKLYVKYANSSNSPLMSVEFSSKNSFDAPIIYTSSDAPRFTSYHLPQVGVSEVQAVSFSKDNQEAFVSLGMFENNKLRFPGDMPEGPAVVLYKHQGHFQPVGFFNPGSSKLLALSDVPAFSKVTTFSTIQSPSQSIKDEQFYVIENEYQQVVFSNFGGAIAELNLPFKSSENTKSVVLPIGIDKKIQTRYPANAYFPTQPYLAAGSKSSQSPHFGGYMPMLRRDLEGASRKKNFETPPRLYGLNVVSEDDPSLAQKQYKLRRLEKDLIEFELSQNSRRIIKTYYFAKAQNEMVPYTLQMDIRIEGDARGLYLTSGVPEAEIMSSNSATPDIKYRYDRNQKTVVQKLKLPKDSAVVKGITPDWVCNANGFFGLILDPLTEVPDGFAAAHIPGSVDPTRLTIIDAKNNLYPADKYPGYIIKMPLKQSSKPLQFRLFGGPFDHNVFAAVDKAFENTQTGYKPDYAAAQTFHGWFTFISEPFAKFLFAIMKFFYNFSKSWGLSIILLTIVLKVILYPLNNWSMRSMSRMQMIQPQVTAIKKRYEKDPKRGNLEVMQLYKDKKVNPFSSCLPMVIQMPFLIGMFDLLRSTFALRGTSFITGWINNLSAPDVLFSWSYPVFFFGTEFHLLPFINGGLMFLQQKCSAMMNKHKVVDPAAQKQSSTSATIMTVVFTLLFYNFPAGLNLYWISSTFLAILQQWIISSQLNKESGKKVSKA